MRKKHLTIVASQHDIVESETKTAPQKAWDQLEGEKKLWYSRLKLYLSLGPKRSLVAAVEKERLTAPAVKSRKKEAEKALACTRPLVPGSWNDACKQWRWVERARAYDAWVVEDIFNQYMIKIHEGLATKSHRLWNLSEIATGLINDMARMSDIKAKSVVAGRVQSIMRQIEEETRTFNGDVERFVLTPQLQDVYSQAHDEYGQEYMSTIVLQTMHENRQIHSREHA